MFAIMASYNYIMSTDEVTQDRSFTHFVYIGIATLENTMVK